MIIGRKCFQLLHELFTVARCYLEHVKPPKIANAVSIMNEKLVSLWKRIISLVHLDQTKDSVWPGCFNAKALIENRELVLKVVGIEKARDNDYAQELQQLLTTD